MCPLDLDVKLFMSRRILNWYVSNCPDILQQTIHKIELHLGYSWRAHRKIRFHNLFSRLTHFCTIWLQFFICSSLFLITRKTVLINELYISCTIIILAKSLYPVTRLKKLQTMGISISAAQYFFSSNVSQNASFKKTHSAAMESSYAWSLFGVQAMSSLRPLPQASSSQLVNRRPQRTM